MKINLDNKQIEDLCKEIRRESFDMIRQAKSGHLGGCSSSTELMATLYFGEILNYNPDNPFDENRDRVVVRGHLGPLRYKIFSILGWLDKNELKTYRSLGSRLQGHESMDLIPGVDITPSGSLGMVLSYGVGAALSGRKQGKGFRVYAFLGDGEEQEGNVAEAARHAARLSLDNLVCILDQNKKQLSHPTSDVDCGDVIEIWRGYGWDVKQIKNGHNIEEVRRVLQESKRANKPVFIVAKTIKGKEIDGCAESYNGYHTISSCPRELLDASINKLESGAVLNSDFPKKLNVRRSKNIKLDIGICPPQKLMGLEDATDIYLRNLESELGKKGIRFYIMTADLMDKEYIDSFEFSPTTKFIDVGIREQHLFACAHGISLTDPNSRVWIHSGDSFLYRSSDQLNAACQGRTGMVIIGDRPGLGGGKNGPTHQSSGQPGVLLTMPGLTFLEPADMEDLYNCLNYAFNDYSGPIYTRLHPGKIETLPSEERKNIDNYIVYDPKLKPHITLVGSGLAMINALDTARDLSEEGIGARLINVVNPKTLNDRFLSKLVADSPVLTLYNGNPFVLESAVSTSIMRATGNKPSQVFSHGFEYGTSGAIEDLLSYFGYDNKSIKRRVRSILK